MSDDAHEHPVPASHRALIDGPHTAVLTTVLADGAPHSAPVWFLADDDGTIRVSTIAGSTKHRNVERDARAGLTVVDPADPMRYVEVRATATATDDPAAEVRDLVVAKHGYTDGAAFDRPGTVRVALHLRPHRVVVR